MGAANEVDIRRLYAITSHLDVGEDVAFLDQWKVALAGGEATEAGTLGDGR